MELQGFLSLFEGYWPGARNIKAPLQQKLWLETVDGIPDDLLIYAVKRYARSAKYPPTVIEFEKHLWPLMDSWAARHPEHSLAAEWIRRQEAWMQAASEADTKPPLRRDCDGCGMSIRREDAIPPKRFEVDGGLVFKEVDGEWFAARCPLCGGPGSHRPAPGGRTKLARFCGPNSLPVPARDEIHHWKAIADTPGGPLWDVVVTERLYAGPDPRFIEWTAWVRTAIDNSRARIQGMIAAEQAAWETKLRDERVAAMEAHRQKRAAAQAAAEPAPEQAVLVMEPPEPGADLDEPAPDLAPGPDPDDTVPF